MKQSSNKRKPVKRKVKAKVKPKPKPKPEVKIIRTIIVSFTLESLKKIVHDARMQKMCYGSVTMADSMGMIKILAALANDENSVIL